MTDAATVDVHAHAIVPHAIEAMRLAMPVHGPELIDDGGARYLVYPGRARLGPLVPGIFDPSVRIADMDRQRVDVQVIAIPPPNFHYHVPADVAVEFARIQNDGLLELAESSPDRFHVFATLPLQDIPSSVDELERVAGFGNVRGIQIGTNVDGTDLDDPRFDPIWDAMGRLDLPAWLHPDQRSIAGIDRITAYYLQNFIGNPLETTVALGRLIFGGVLDRYPDVRFGFVHGAGFVPYQIGRWDHGWGVRPESREWIGQTPPGDYFRRVYADSLTHDRLALELLGARLGWDHVLLGSDYPFDMASDDPVGAVDALGLDQADRSAVLSHNADRFLRRMS